MLQNGSRLFYNNGMLKQVAFGGILLGVFGLGFLAGIVWQARSASTVSEPASAVAPSDRAFGCLPENLAEEERKISDALEDPEFRRVHDHLTRENPIQMNLPGIPSTSEERPATMSEREPVRFILP